MLGLRRDSSLLLSEGHVESRRYSIGMLINEARIVRQRYNAKWRDKIMVGVLLTDLCNMGATSKQRKDTHKKIDELLKEYFSDDT